MNIVKEKREIDKNEEDEEQTDENVEDAGISWGMSKNSLYLSFVSNIKYYVLEESVADLRGAARGSCPSLTELKQVWCPFFEMV